MKEEFVPKNGSIPEQFVREGSISVEDAIRRVSPVDVRELNLFQSLSNDSSFVGRTGRDLEILQALARWDVTEYEFLELIRRDYVVDSDMSWDDTFPFFEAFAGMETHPLFGLFIPELLCKIEDHDMYKFTTFGPRVPVLGPKGAQDVNQKYLEKVDRLFRSSPRLSIVRFVEFLKSVLNAASEVGKSEVNFTLLWNLYKNKHKKQKQSASQKRVLTQFLRRCIGSEAYLSRGMNIWITKNTGFRKGEKNRIPIHVPYQQSGFKQSPEYIHYKNYLSTFVNSMTHVKCASKFTRLSKLYSKPLVFTFCPSEQLDLTAGDIRKHKNIFHYPPKNEKHTIADTEQMIAGYYKQLLKHSGESENGQKIRKYISQMYKKQSEIGFHNNLKRARALPEMAHLKGWNKLHDYLESKFHPIRISGDDFLKWHHTNTAGVVPLVINGGAGMGKTIRLTQFARTYASELSKIHDMVDLKLVKPANHFPVFLKAKRCWNTQISNRIRHSNPSDAAEIVWTLKEMMVASNPDLLNHMSHGELKDAIRTWLSKENLHRSSFVLFIDGLDECPSEEAASELMNWFMNLQTSQPPTIILSTRPSHYEVAANILGDHGCVEMLADMGYYTKQELSHDIPMRLCDAWGLTRHSARTLSQVFSSYESILQHPLFVGWFCFLILNDEVESLGATDRDAEISRNNLISKIISIGIKSSLERREAEHSGSVDDPASDEFLRMLRTFVAVAFHFDLANPKQVYEHMKRYKLAAEVPPSIRRSIEQHCGILFLTGDSVEWTHQTIPELMYADFYFEHPEIHHWGPLKATSPVLSRLAQLSYERGGMNSYSEAMMRLSFVHDNHQFNELRIETWIDCENERRHLLGLDDAKNLIPILDGNQPHEIQLTKLYIENLDSKACFPLYFDLIEPSRKRETVQKILSHSNDPFGRDLITPEDEMNLVHIDDVRTELVLRKTKIADCIEYYRMILADFTCLPETKLDLEHAVFSIHKKAKNPEHLFFINHISGWAKHMVFESGHADTWLRPWRVDQNASDDAEFYTQERMRLIQFISEEYVETAYKALFGNEHWVDLLNTVYEQTYLSEIDAIVASGAYGDTVERRNLLNHYMTLHSLNDLVSIDAVHIRPADILDRYNTNNIYVRGIVMMPFVAECLMYNEGTKRNDLIQFLEDQPDFLPFQIISNYASRIISTSDGS